jgi:hypothetical protein
MSQRYKRTNCKILEKVYLRDQEESGRVTLRLFLGTRLCPMLGFYVNSVET